MAVLIGVAALALAGCERRVAVPEIRGRVLDARTGEPLAGATVLRKLYHEPPVDFVDTRAVEPIEDSLRTAQTDAEGRFALAGEVVSSVAGMAWAVFKPGWMPAGACYRGEPQWSRRGGCGGASPRFSDIQKDAWTSFATVTRTDVLEIEVRLHPPTVEGITWPRATTWYEYNPDTGKHDLEKHFPEDVDPWGGYFKRVRALVDYRFLPAETFVDEAVAYLERGEPLTEEMLPEIGTLISGLDASSETVWSQDARIRRLATAVVTYCMETPTSQYCRPRTDVMIRHLHEYLAKRVQNDR